MVIVRGTVTQELRIFLRLALVVWLAAAPLLSAAHAVEHEDAHDYGHACVVCQLGDRDGDFDVPVGVTLEPNLGARVPVFSAPQSGQTGFLLTANSRGPPLSAQR